MHPTPLPLATIRSRSSTTTPRSTATYEVDAEQGLARLHRATSPTSSATVSTDYYGNAAVHRLPAHDRNAADARSLFDADDQAGRRHDAARPASAPATPPGVIMIPNLGPNRYAATVTPPARPGATSGCRRRRSRAATTTTSGCQEGDDRLRHRASPRAPSRSRRCSSASSATQAITVPRRNAPTGEVKGVAVAGLPYIGGQNGQVVPETGFAGAKFGGPITQPVGRAVRPRRAVTRRSTSAAARADGSLRHQERARTAPTS